MNIAQTGLWTEWFTKFLNGALFMKGYFLEQWELTGADGGLFEYELITNLKRGVFICSFRQTVLDKSEWRSSLCSKRYVCMLSFLVLA